MNIEAIDGWTQPPHTVPFLYQRAVTMWGTGKLDPFLIEWQTLVRFDRCTVLSVSDRCAETFANVFINQAPPTWDYVKNLPKLLARLD